MSDDRTARALRAKRVMFVGVVVFIASAVMMLIPALIGAKLGRFVAAGAVVGIVTALSLMLNGAIDWWRR